MEDPKLVSELTTAIHDGCDGRLPVTVKCRIGTDTHTEPFSKDGYAEIDPQVEYSRLCKFIEQVASNSPVTDFSVHARIAVLRKSFSPADNRKIPPLVRISKEKSYNFYVVTSENKDIDIVLFLQLCM